MSFLWFTQKTKWEIVHYSKEDWSWSTEAKQQKQMYIYSILLIYTVHSTLRIFFLDKIVSTAAIFHLCSISLRSSVLPISCKKHYFQHSPWQIFLRVSSTNRRTISLTHSMGCHPDPTLFLSSFLSLPFFSTPLILLSFLLLPPSLAPPHSPRCLFLCPASHTHHSSSFLACKLPSDQNLRWQFN